MVRLPDEQMVAITNNVRLRGRGQFPEPKPDTCKERAAGQELWPSLAGKVQGNKYSDLTVLPPTYLLLVPPTGLVICNGACCNTHAPACQAHGR